jgi:hypothetical protein
MKGRVRGKPTKWVHASIAETVAIGKPGMTFEIWDKWRKKRRKVGTLTISVGGLRWWPHKAPAARQRTWDELDLWFNS